MSQYLKKIRTRPGSAAASGSTPQSQPILGSAQIPNSAGGYGFKVDDWKRLERWLILGSEGGTYYAAESTLTAENASVVLRCIREDGRRLVSTVEAVSRAGRAPKNEPALLALALAASHGDLETRRAAFDSLPIVARTGTHLFHFASFVNGQRGWGKGLQRAIGRWYNEREAKDLAYQAIKYQQRDGWSHRDLLRKTHLRPATEAHQILYHWIASQGWDWVGADPHPDERVRQVWAYESAQRAGTASEVASLVAAHRLPREAVPTQWLNEPEVWEALLQEMPLMALIRNLATLTRIGVLGGNGQTTRRVAEQLTSEEHLRRARVHPVAILAALKTYQQGHGERGRNVWEPVSQIVDALDSAFYKAFATVEPTGKRWLLALDVSGSMDSGAVAGVPGLTPRLAAAAMAMVTAAVENDYTVVGFSAPSAGAGYGGRWSGATPGIQRISISPRQRLDDVVSTMRKVPMGGTDCSLPMQWALKERKSVDVFAIYTDNETWYGKMHPVEALARYRAEMEVNARLVVTALTPTQFSIADPDDAGTLDVVGFDTAAPQLISEFATGRL